MRTFESSANLSVLEHGILTQFMHQIHQSSNEKFRQQYELFFKMNNISPEEDEFFLQCFIFGVDLRTDNLFLSGGRVHKGGGFYRNEPVNIKTDIDMIPVSLLKLNQSKEIPIEINLPVYVQDDDKDGDPEMDMLKMSIYKKDVPDVEPKPPIDQLIYSFVEKYQMMLIPSMKQKKVDKRRHWWNRFHKGG